MTAASPQATRLSQLESFLRQDPDNPGLLREAFHAAVSAGFFDAAEFHLVHATRLGQDAWAWGLEAVHLDLARHRWDDAAQRAGALLDEPGSPAGMRDALDHAVAYAAFRQERWEQASAVLSPLLARAASSGSALPDATQALALRVWHHRHDVDNALDWARTQSGNGTLAREATGVASLVALDAGDFASAQQWVRAHLESGEPCAEALVTASSLATTGRDADAGQRFARAALSLNPSDGRALSALGLAQMLTGQLAEARASFESALLTLPDHVGTWIALGWAELVMDDLVASLATFERAVACDRNFGEAHGSLAAAQARLGLREEALAGIERARRLDASGLSLVYAQRLLDGQGLQGDRGLLPLARRLLGSRQSPLGGTMADWLPLDVPLSR